MEQTDSGGHSHEVMARVRVRYFETDQMGVAYYAHYLVWFEVARAEFCRGRGIDYRQMEQEGYFLPVAEATCRYKAPARYDDELTIAVRVLRRSRRTVRFGYRVLRGDETIAEGETVQVLVGRDGKPCAFPPHIAALFEVPSDSSDGSDQSDAAGGAAS